MPTVGKFDGLFGSVGSKISASVSCAPYIFLFLYSNVSGYNKNGPFSLVDSIYFPDSTYIHSSVDGNQESHFYYLNL